MLNIAQVYPAWYKSLRSLGKPCDFRFSQPQDYPELYSTLF